MKINKKQAGWIAGLVCVILLLLLLLTMCGREDSVDPTEPVETTTVPAETEQNTTAPVETEPEETAEATEETTEATEETEESTEPTTGGSTTPGGTGGYNPGLGGGNTDTNQPETPTTPAAGSAESPYIDFVAQLPDSFQTVAIPADSTVYHSIYGVDGSVLTIADPEAYVIYGEQTYAPNEDGIVEVVLAAAETDGTPVVLQVGSKSTEEKAYELTFQAPLGSERNPEPIIPEENSFALEISLEEGAAEGYFYQYVAQENSRLTLTLDEITEDVACDVVVTVGETVVKLSESEDGSVTVDMKQEDIAKIQVITVPAEDGTYPAADIKISGILESAPGSSANPIVVYGEFPIVTEEIAPGASVFYSVFGANNMLLKVEATDVCITIDGVTIVPVDGAVSTLITAADPRTPVSLVVGNSGEEAKSFTLEFIAPVGTMSNPDAMIEGENTVTIAEGNTEGYWLTWTAEADAVVTITMPTDVDWMYSVIHTSGDVETVSDTQWSDSDPYVPTYELQVTSGDVVTVMVSTYEPVEPWAPPAGELTFTMSVVQHLNVTYQGAEITLEPGETAFCKAMIRAESIILKVAGEGDFTVTMGGRNYAPVNGLVTIEDLKTDFYNPVEFTVTNNMDTAATYTLSYENPVGSGANPAPITDMGEYTSEIRGDGEGYFYTWIATADGQFTITLQGDDWAYTINNLTSYQYGSNRVSTNGDPAAETITVKAGDQIQINVGTASRENKQVTILVAFQSTEQSGEDPSEEGTTPSEPTEGDTTPEDATETGAGPEDSVQETPTTENSDNASVDTTSATEETSAGDSSEEVNE